MRATFLYTTLLVLLSFTSAWPWPRFLPELDSLVVRRQNKADTTAATVSPTATPTPTPTPTPTTAAKSTGSIGKTTAPSTTGSSRPNASSSGSVSGSGKSGSSSAKPTTTKRTSYDPRLPAGGITMLTPAATIVTPIYKIGDYVTFGFNYTSLSVTPTALNILATCTANSQTYTIATNHTADNGEVVWDTAVSSSGAPPLLTEKYTLIIYDVDGTATDVAQAGYLAPFKGLAFGMYDKKPYSDEGSIKCATCSGALSSLERSALSFVFGMGLATVLGFTWFVGGLDVIW